jgi:hypothetical protein
MCTNSQPLVFGASAPPTGLYSSALPRRLPGREATQCGFEDEANGTRFFGLPRPFDFKGFCCRPKNRFPRIRVTIPRPPLPTAFPCSDTGARR